MGCRINGPVLYFSARRVLAKEVVAFPVRRRANWPGNKTTTTIGADVSQNAVNTCCAERTFVAANARVDRIGWQRCVAVLARWSEFKHRSIPFRYKWYFPRKPVSPKIAQRLMGWTQIV